VQIALFYLFAFLALLSALMVITRKNPVTSALFLVMCFFSLAGIYVLMSAFFLAAVQVAVYAGAIMVLFLFVIMLLNLDPKEIPSFMNRKIKWLSLLVTALLVALLLGLAAPQAFPHATGAAAGEVWAIGDLIFGEYLLAFELTAVLLLMAILASVILAKKEL
jgi:NADH-quinone oxidoreductase subunit J